MAVCPLPPRKNAFPLGSKKPGPVSPAKLVPSDCQMETGKLASGIHRFNDGMKRSEVFVSLSTVKMLLSGHLTQVASFTKPAGALTLVHVFALGL